MPTPERYLSLLKKALVNELYVEAEAQVVYLLHAMVNGRPAEIDVVNRIRQAGTIIDLIRRGKEIGRTVEINDSHGRPLQALRGAIEIAHTMIGRKRLDNLHQCLDAVRVDGVAGDLIETGVWRGGATIFMRGYLEAWDLPDRQVWVADSFDGLPEPTLPQDQGVDLSKSVAPFLAVGLDEVRELFARYDLLDDRVRFLKGWFRDTLFTAPIARLAILRLDGDLYESTMDALVALYDKVSAGGFVIVDDYHTNPTCQAAIHDFRRDRGVAEPLLEIDADGVYWRKTAP